MQIAPARSTVSTVSDCFRKRLETVGALRPTTVSGYHRAAGAVAGNSDERTPRNRSRFEGIAAKAGNSRIAAEAVAR